MNINYKLNILTYLFFSLIVDFDIVYLRSEV